ncbi:MAG TPA: DMT family transporter [Myxococcaceae bacterium]|nr:DMT family transporter [Myxococcaceae bacterium]
MTHERRIGLACGLLSVLLFSSFTLVSRLGLSSRLQLVDLAALRFGIGGSLLLPALLRADLRSVTWRQATALALLGGLGFALLAYTGFSLAPAAHGAVLLHGTLPLFTFLILRTTTGRGDSGPPALGIGLIAAGIALMAYDSLTAASPRQLAGDGFLLLASLSWSSYGVLSRRLGLPAASGAAIVAVLSLCAFLPFYVLWRGNSLPTSSVRELLLQAVVQGVLIGAVSILVYTRAVAALGPQTTSLMAAAVPVITTLAAIPLLSEIPSRPALAGVGVVTAGMVAARPRGRRAAGS